MQTRAKPLSSIEERWQDAKALAPSSRCKPDVKRVKHSPLRVSLGPQERGTQLKRVRGTQRVAPEQSLGRRLHRIDVHDHKCRAHEICENLLNAGGVFRPDHAISNEALEGRPGFNRREGPQR